VLPADRAGVGFSLGKTAPTTRRGVAGLAFGFAAGLALELRGILFAVAARHGGGVVELAGLGHFVAATANEIDGNTAQFGEDGVGLVGPFFEGDFGGVAFVGVGAVNAVSGVGTEGVTQGV
jgi:hypothetical protein